jgi:hypothetical protein
LQAQTRGPEDRRVPAGAGKGGLSFPVHHAGLAFTR